MSVPNPFTKACVRLDLPETSLGRPVISITREASEIGRGVLPGAIQTKDAFRVGGEAWILRPVFSEALQTVKTGVSGMFLTAADVTTDPAIVSRDKFRPSSLPGVTGTGSLLSTGGPAFEKRVSGNGGLFSVAISSSLPSPNADAILAQTVPVERILTGKNAAPENTPYRLSLRVPYAAMGYDTIARFMFGGAAAVDPSSASGGHFCLELRGGGAAVLSEYDEHSTAGDPWKERMRLQIAKPDLGFRTAHVLDISIIPYGANRIAFMGADMPFSQGGATLFPLLLEVATVGLTGKKSAVRQVYRETEKAAGHSHVWSITGPGAVDFDLRQNLRGPFHIIQGKYVTTATVSDGCHTFPYPLPANEAIRLTPDAELPPGTAVSGVLYDAGTGLALPTDGAGRFLSTAGLQKVYAVFTLTGDGKQTPVLWGYRILVQGAYQDSTPAPGEINQFVRNVEITGPDVSPDHESASCLVRDIRGAYPGLRTRGRHRADLILRNRQSGALVSRLFEGESMSPRSKKRASSHYPSWWDVSMRFVGLWTRLNEKFSVSEPIDFRQDPDAPTDPRTGRAARLPWKVTDIIRYCLNSCGVPDVEIDLPNLNVRLWPSKDLDTEDYLLTPGTSYGAYIQKLAKEYLGMILLRDPNAGAVDAYGPRGMWRLLFNPQPPYGAPVVSFSLSRAGLPAGRVATAPGAWGTAATWIEANSYDEWVVPPECNYVMVSTVGDLLPASGDGRFRYSQWMWNPKSFNWPGLTPTADPSHPDYLPGGFTPVFVYDPTLGSQAAVNVATRRIFDFSAHAEKWFSFYAPQILITNPADPYQRLPRLPRINDLALVNGYPALIRNCNPEGPLDQTRRIYVEGKYL